MNFGGAGFKIADPYIHLARISYNFGSYDAGPLFRVNAGLIKPMFTYNDAMSSASLTFLERAAAVNVATETFGGGAPRLGAELTFQQTDLLRDGDNLMVSGAFTGHIASKRASEFSSDANSDGTHLLGRIAYRLWSDGVSNFQIGGDVSRILTVGGPAGPGGARSLSLQDEPEIQVDGNALVDTGPLPAERRRIVGHRGGSEFAQFLPRGRVLRVRHRARHVMCRRLRGRRRSRVLRLVRRGFVDAHGRGENLSGQCS